MELTLEGSECLPALGVPLAGVRVAKCGVVLKQSQSPNTHFHASRMSAAVLSVLHLGHVSKCAAASAPATSATATASLSGKLTAHVPSSSSSSSSDHDHTGASNDLHSKNRLTKKLAERPLSVAGTASKAEAAPSCAARTWVFCCSAPSKVVGGSRTVVVGASSLASCSEQSLLVAQPPSIHSPCLRSRLDMLRAMLSCGMCCVKLCFDLFDAVSLQASMSSNNSVLSWFKI